MSPFSKMLELYCTPEGREKLRLARKEWALRRIKAQPFYGSRS